MVGLVTQRAQPDSGDNIALSSSTLLAKFVLWETKVTLALATCPHRAVRSLGRAVHCRSLIGRGLVESSCIGSIAATFLALLMVSNSVVLVSA
jgi:hypothetical protein